MKCHLKTQIFTGQIAMLKERGDVIWTALCDAIHCDRPFTIRDLMNNQDFLRWAQLSTLTHITARQYTRTVLINVLIEWENDPDPSLIRTGNTWCLPSVPQ
jgi:hypothetical protein